MAQDSITVHEGGDCVDIDVSSNMPPKYLCDPKTYDRADCSVSIQVFEEKHPDDME